MRTTDFSKVLFDALQYSGNDRHNITSETFAQFRDFASARMREAWESNQWADICRLSPFTASIDVNNVAYFTPVEEADEILGVYTRNPQESTKAIQMAYQIYDSGSSINTIPVFHNPKLQPQTFPVINLNIQNYIFPKVVQLFVDYCNYD